MRLIIKNGFICDVETDPIKKDVLIEYGVISKIDEHIEASLADTIDAEGKYIIPGLIDMFCNVNDPGFEYKEDIVSISKSATKGGFTSISCVPNTKPVIDDKTVVNYIINKSKKLSKVNILPYGSMTKNNEGLFMSEIGEMIDAGVVALSDAGIAVQDSKLMRNILLYTSMFNIPIITICDDKNLTEETVVNRGLISTKTGLKGAPREAEEIMLFRNLTLAKYNNCKIHITQVTTKGAVELIRQAKKEGINVTCDTCPHYFTLSEDIVESYNTFGKIWPPLRTEEDIESIKEALLDGTIDVISSGHTPATIESKNLEFDRAEFGISSIETAFSVSYNSLVKPNILTLKQLVEKMSYLPSKILNLENKGQIKENFDADLVIFDAKSSYKINAAEFATKSKYSPYNGITVFGEVLYTIVNGNIVFLKDI